MKFSLTLSSLWIACSLVVTPASAKDAKPDIEKLFTKFYRIANLLPDGAHNDVVSHFKERMTFLNEESRFEYLEMPQDLILIVSYNINSAYYRAGELILPYRFKPKGKPLSDAKEKEHAQALWDYFVGLSIFDANMHFKAGESEAWDNYQKSYQLLQQLYRLNSYIDEDIFVKTQTTTRQSAKSRKAFKDNAQAAIKQRDTLLKIIRERNKSAQVKYSDAYVFELHTYFASLFSDLLVSILHQDPNKMTDLMTLSGYQEFVSDAPFRSFLPTQTNPDYDPLGYKFTHFFTPLRPFLWDDITQKNSDQDAQLRSLQSLFLRMRVVFKDILKALDKRTIHSGIYYPIGETGQDFLHHLGLDRKEIIKRLQVGLCEANLSAEE